MRLASAILLALLLAGCASSPAPTTTSAPSTSNTPTIPGCVTCNETATPPTGTPTPSTSAPITTTPPPNGTSSAAASVGIVNFAFSPTEFRVAVGTNVTWSNAGESGHTVTADDGSFDSGRIDPGASFSHVFDAPGTYAYHCAFHGSMKATVVVG